MNMPVTSKGPKDWFRSCCEIDAGRFWMGRSLREGPDWRVDSGVIGKKGFNMVIISFDDFQGSLRVAAKVNDIEPVNFEPFLDELPEALPVILFVAHDGRDLFLRQGFQTVVM